MLLNDECVWAVGSFVSTQSFYLKRELANAVSSSSYAARIVNDPAESIFEARRASVFVT